MEPDDLTVVDDTKARRFRIDLGEADAELVYRSDGKRLVLLHTEVPREFREQGIGGQLVRAAVERAADNGETLTPRCGYTRQWLRAHADVASRVTVDWSDAPVVPGG